MRGSRRPGLPQALPIAIGLVASMLAVLALGAWMLLQGRDEPARNVLDKRASRQQGLADIEHTLARTALEVRRAILAQDPRTRQQALDAIAEERLALHRTLAGLEEAMTRPGAHEAFMPIRADLAEFWHLVDQTTTLMDRGRVHEASAHLRERSTPAADRLLQQVKVERARQDEELSSRLLVLRDEAVFARDTLLAALLLIWIALAARALHGVGALRRPNGASAPRRAAQALRGGASPD